MNRTLSESNTYLRTASKRKKAVHLTVATSSAIEGIREPFKSHKKVEAKVASRKIARTSTTGKFVKKPNNSSNRKPAKSA